MVPRCLPIQHYLVKIRSEATQLLKESALTGKPSGMIDTRNGLTGSFKVSCSKERNIGTSWLRRKQRRQAWCRAIKSTCRCIDWESFEGRKRHPSSTASQWNEIKNCLLKSFNEQNDARMAPHRGPFKPLTSAVAAKTV